MGSKRKKQSWQSSSQEGIDEFVQTDTVDVGSEESAVRVWDMLAGAGVVIILVIIAFAISF